MKPSHPTNEREMKMREKVENRQVSEATAELRKISDQTANLFTIVAFKMYNSCARSLTRFKESKFYKNVESDRGDVPGWVLVVLMTTGLVTAIWTIAAPRLSTILKNSLDAMNGIR